jgi:hypothetical protein
MDLVDVGWRDVDWIDLAHDRDRWRALVNAVMNLRAGKLSSALTTRDLSSSARLHGVKHTGHNRAIQTTNIVSFLSQRTKILEGGWYNSRE